ncbi:MAG: class I SAM-dependent methyltransferase [Chitinophagaceae bacterium]|nr:class I SAM-dependent methyltransferase [Chitinophagaceae bacterium]
MYSPYKKVLRYLGYRLRSSSGKGHGVHSPFVFSFITDVLNDKTQYPEYKQIENIRSKLLADNTPVPLEDYGAGSVAGLGSRSVSSITASAAKSPKFAALLFRIARHYRPHYILELGTSLGISTSYLASADKNAAIVSGEGNFVLASMAKSNFESLELHNIQIVTGNFDNTLPQMVRAIPHIDMAFIDGNHREKPTIKYFHELLSKVSPSSVIIFDDIHWSAEMEAAWRYIKNHASVMLSIDLFFMGIVFFRPEFKVKQHFSIRF